MRLVQLPRSIGAGFLMLQWGRFGDLPRLYPCFRAEIFATASGVTRAPFASRFSFSLWLWRTFPLRYVVHVEASGRRRIVGFVGLYHLDLGCSLHCALVIFDPADRRCGYGRQTVALLLRALAHHQVVQTVRVEVGQVPESL